MRGINAFHCILLFLSLHFSLLSHFIFFDNDVYMVYTPPFASALIATSSHQTIPRSFVLRSLNKLRVEKSNESYSDALETTRASLATLIDRSWQRVEAMLPSSALAATQGQLKIATIMLVMAAVRDNDVESIFKAADRNQDGSLSFSEWQEWLGGEGESDDRKDKKDSVILDPVLATCIGQVLSHAVASLKVVSRLGCTSDELCAAYVAGGIMSK